jgi:hypothetical protein
MQNVVLIGLVLVIVIFAVYQYNPSVFRFMRRDGFADMMKDDKKGPLDPVLARAHGNEKAGQMASPGAPQAVLNSTAGFVNPVPPGDPQSQQAYGNNLKTQPEEKKSQGFADLSSFEGPANFGAAEAPAGCYPRDQLTPAELLPKDMNSIWAEQNPMGPGSLKGKNFLSAGALIGVNTVGQSLRNANLQIRSEPPNPQVPVSIFLQSTIGPDISHRTLEIN